LENWRKGWRKGWREVLERMIDKTQPDFLEVRRKYYYLWYMVINIPRGSL